MRPPRRPCATTRTPSCAAPPSRPSAPPLRHDEPRVPCRQQRRPRRRRAWRDQPVGAERPARPRRGAPRGSAHGLRLRRQLAAPADGRPHWPPGGSAFCPPGRLWYRAAGRRRARPGDRPRRPAAGDGLSVGGAQGVWPPGRACGRGAVRGGGGDDAGAAQSGPRAGDHPGNGRTGPADGCAVPLLGTAPRPGTHDLAVPPGRAGLIPFGRHRAGPGPLSDAERGNTNGTLALLSPSPRGGEGRGEIPTT